MKFPIHLFLFLLPMAGACGNLSSIPPFPSDEVKRYCVGSATDEEMRYEEEFWYGKPSGQVIGLFENSFKYVSQFNDGQRQGNLTYTWSNPEKNKQTLPSHNYLAPSKRAFNDGYTHTGEWRDVQFVAASALTDRPLSSVPPNINFGAAIGNPDFKSIGSVLIKDEDEKWFAYRSHSMNGVILLYQCLAPDVNPGEMLALFKKGGGKYESSHLANEIMQNGKIVAVELKITGTGSMNFIRGKKRCENLIGYFNDEIKRRENLQDVEGKTLSDKYK